ncbi:MAG: DUF2132 domain-containing protein [Cryobacterium sp.]|nr:DUF2132 domain-containing protein [Oligoflexia bacterium]
MAKDPLEGMTLEKILERLVSHFGWKELGRIIDIKCFNIDPSIKSSLTFLRRNPWARAHVETLYRELVAESGS